MRVVLDTNLWISYLLTRNERSTIRQVVQAALAGKVDLIVPEELIAELRTSADYPHLTQRIAPDELNDVVRQIRRVAHIPSPLSQELKQYSRDRKDDYLVAYGLIYEADYLVTGDRDLLTLGRIERLQMVTPATFRRILEEENA